jgi:hypothetical protein
MAVCENRNIGRANVGMDKFGRAVLVSDLDQESHNLFSGIRENVAPRYSPQSDKSTSRV